MMAKRLYPSGGESLLPQPTRRAPTRAHPARDASHQHGGQPELFEKTVHVMFHGGDANAQMGPDPDLFVRETLPDQTLRNQGRNKGSGVFVSLTM
jgi:hypothetical protein